ncbi:PREDICTED: probable complex I intermediate-associated protein 30, mitochondrial [Ceratosolen solmsi marchali]|uniref:Probable complex I intermediate-associated protein 30, mitochondrial n=1 Tax=Ceratosolen solmsi marchali TaxID=326594 RepID=A0AAJ6YEK4_9HYME|nr:PREDICTED: probable complex I intermediate-associated protein 30, mitochondrial [Ceratosolen solmsi marchali]
MKLSSLKLLTNIGKRNIHISKCTSLFYEDPGKQGLRIKSDRELEWEKMSFLNKCSIELNLYKEGIKETIQNYIKDTIRGPQYFIYDHEVNVEWRFTGDKVELNNWIVSSDKDFNMGYSTAQLEYTPESKGIFHGFLDMKLPADGKQKNTGFCNLRTVARLDPFKNVVPYDWHAYNHLVLHLRGDGRIYTINLHMERTFDMCMYDIYQYFIWTRGGPYWQHVRIPFSKFFFTYKGRIQSLTTAMPRSEVKFISVTIADKIDGPFQLEIDYIGVEYDPTHIEECAYENYDY